MRRTGYDLVRTVLTDAGALWCLLVALRALWLLRPDASGHPFVTNAFDSWSISAALEWVHWIPITVPALIIGLEVGEGLVPRPARLAAHALVGGAGFLVLFLSIVDMEAMRFTGAHLNWGLVRALGRPNGVSALFAALRADHGGPFVVLPVLIISLAWWIRRQTLGLAGVLGSARTTTPREGFRILAIAAALTIMAAVVAIPTKDFPAWRLASAFTVVSQEWNAPLPTDLSLDQYARLRNKYQLEWYEGASPGDAATWVFPEPAYPFYRMTRSGACAAGLAVGVNCNADSDRDGSPLAEDCSDSDPRSHPGAVDVPGDGIDQDCDGVDAEPWNVILIVFDAFRGAGVGHLGPWGAEVLDATPTLDAMARDGAAYTRVWANGVTRASEFMTIHTGIEPHPFADVARRYTMTALDGFPRVLGAHGYQTCFFTTDTPESDNFAFWLWPWYDAVTHDARGANDRVTFSRAAAWLTGERDARKPFLATIWAGADEPPFDGRREGEAVSEDLDTKGRVTLTMRRSDEQLAAFLDAIGSQPWFAHTIVIVTGAHGFPLGEHGTLEIGQNLYGDSTWVPLVISGHHPKLRRGFDDRPASHVDLAPTVLDLLGIEAPNAFSGHSLAQTARDPVSVGLLAPDIAYARGDLRAIVSQPGMTRPAGDEMFSTSRDRLDLMPTNGPPGARDAFVAAARDRAFLYSWAYDRDWILPEKPPHAVPASAAE